MGVGGGGHDMEGSTKHYFKKWWGKGLFHKDNTRGQFPGKGGKGDFCIPIPQCLQ